MILRILRGLVGKRERKIIWVYKQTEHYRFSCYVNWYEETTGWAWQGSFIGYWNSSRPLFSRDEMR